MNNENFQLKCSEVSFLGHVMTMDWLKADPKKVDAKVERPADIPAVQKFIGLAKYLSKFLQGLSEIREPLRRLTLKNANWNWTDEREDAFERIKKVIVKAPVLKYFSQSDRTEGQGDAIQHWLGLALIRRCYLCSIVSHWHLQVEYSLLQGAITSKLKRHN